MTLPRNALGMIRLNSGQVGIRSIRPLNGVNWLRMSRFLVISAMPKQPSATLIRPTPSARNGNCKVKRCEPLMTSVPTAPSSTPTSVIARPLRMLPGSDVAHADEAQQHQRAVVRRPEQEGHLGKRLRQRGQDDDGEAAADEAGNAGREQRQSGLSLERHRVAVDAGDDAAGVRDLHGDRAHAVAVLGAVVDAGQHDQRAAGGDRIGQRQQEADRRQRPEPGQQAHQGADGAADRAIHQVVQRQRVARNRRRGCAGCPSLVRQRRGRLRPSR